MTVTSRSPHSHIRSPHAPRVRPNHLDLDGHGRSNEIDDRYVEIARVHGEEGARIAASSHTAAIDFIGSSVREHDVDCDFTRIDGYLFLAEGRGPARIHRPLKEFVKENANVGVMYTEWVRPLDGVYRDEEGALHEMSAVCPHLKCIVHWNTLEKSWDCPCHGSRFDAYGKVFTGPAVSSLEPVAAEEKSSGRG